MGVMVSLSFSRCVCRCWFLFGFVNYIICCWVGGVDGFVPLFYFFFFLFSLVALFVCAFRSFFCCFFFLFFFFCFICSRGVSLAPRVGGNVLFAPGGGSSECLFLRSGAFWVSKQTPPFSPVFLFFGWLL